MAIPRNLANFANQLNTDGETPKIEAGDSSVVVTDSGTGKIEFTVDAVEIADFTTGAVVFNETGANQDFRVEGDTNANMLVVDASVDRIGIGTSTPDEVVHISYANPILKMRSTTNGGTCALRFDMPASNGLNASGFRAKIEVVHVPSWVTEMRFFAGNSNGVEAPEAMRIIDGGELLIGYTSDNGAYRLQVNGQIFATSATIATSDGRYKENIVPLTGALSDVCALNPVQFSWKKHPVHDFDIETPTVGFIAQEVQ